MSDGVLGSAACLHAVELQGADWGREGLLLPFVHWVIILICRVGGDFNFLLFTFTVGVQRLPPAECYCALLKLLVEQLHFSLCILEMGLQVSGRSQMLVT